METGCAEIYKVFSVHDAQLYDERYNLLHAFLAAVPGNYMHNFRYLYILNTNYADNGVSRRPARPGATATSTTRSSTSQPTRRSRSRRFAKTQSRRPRRRATMLRSRPSRSGKRSDRSTGTQTSRLTACSLPSSARSGTNGATSTTRGGTGGEHNRRIGRPGEMPVSVPRQTAENSLVVRIKKRRAGRNAPAGFVRGRSSIAGVAGEAGLRCCLRRASSLGPFFGPSARPVPCAYRR